MVNVKSERLALDRRFCVAPMMDCTDRHERYLLRLISRHALLYTEMVTSKAIVNGDAKRLLQYNEQEHPLAIQLGGSDPDELATSSKIAQDFGYDEINLNVGCPSDRVQSGRFGACLMMEPERVAECVSSMKAVVDVPVTVKCRTGVDDRDSYPELCEFIEKVASAGCRTFIVHARKAWLKGLSPKQNREIPPIDYELVRVLKEDYPHLEIIINGAIKTLDAAYYHSGYVDGVMLGREVYHNPYVLADVDQLFYGDDHVVADRVEILKRYEQYAEQQLSSGVPLHSVVRHALGLFNGLPGARAWRRTLSAQALKLSPDARVLSAAASLVTVQ